MDPNQQFGAPNQPQTPGPNVYGSPTLPNPMNLGQPPIPKPTGAGKGRLIIIIAGVLGFVMVLVIILVVALGGKDTPPLPEEVVNTEPQGPQPAQALDVEQTYNSINIDITSINDDVDLPEDELSDDEIGL